MNAPAPGFYDDGNGSRRWWDGRAWTSHVEQGAAPDPGGAPSDVRVSVLNAEVAKYVAQGYSVEANDGTQAVLSRRIPTSFVLNTIGVILTGGLWLIYILVRIGSPRFERRVVTVDRNGMINGRL